VTPDPMALRCRRVCFGITMAGSALFLFGGCASHAPPVSAPQRSQAGSEGDLRVMTFNLRVRKILDGPNIWDLRRDLLVERIRNFDPDLLGTQEGLDFMESFLRQQLKDYTFFGAGRGDGGPTGEMCGVFYRSARFERLDSGHFWLSTTPDKPGSRAWGALVPRMVTWVKLRPRDGGPAFCWFNTHFDAWNPHVRTRSAGVLRDWMSRIAGPMPCIVTGDFNSNAGSKAYRTLLAEQQPASASLHDAFRATHPIATRKEGTVHFFTGWRGGRRIDWILASSHFQTPYAEIDHTRGPRGYPSDHFPVIAVLRADAPEEHQPLKTHPAGRPVD
jgi:endonuclease/exonuclease/phosphatase family metal-dependent hydrolase